MKKFDINHFDTYFFDLDGTLYLGNQIIKGADILVGKLRSLNKNVYAITNNCILSNTRYFEKLKNLQIPISPQNVINSTTTVINWIQTSSYANKNIFVFGTADFKEQVKKQSPIKIVSTPKEANLIVIGNNTNLTWENLNDVAIAIQHSTPYIVANSDLRLPLGDNLYGVDTGTIAALLETITLKKPVVVLGKTFSHFLDQFITGKAIFIGDRIYTDMQCAKNAGINNCLVLSGESTYENYVTHSRKIDFYINSIADLLTVN